MVKIFLDLPWMPKADNAESTIGCTFSGVKASAWSGTEGGLSVMELDA